MRSSQRPGASTSAGVGSSRAEAHRPAERRPRPLARRHRRRRPRPGRTGPARAPGRTGAPRTGRPVTSPPGAVAALRPGDRRPGRAPRRPGPSRGRRSPRSPPSGLRAAPAPGAARASGWHQHGLGILEARFQRLEIGGVERAELGFEGGRIRPEAAHVGDQELLQTGPHVGPAEDRVVGQLAERDPQQQVVERQAPVLGEGLEVGRDDDELVRRGAGDGQVVLPRTAPCDRLPTITPACMPSSIGVINDVRLPRSCPVGSGVPSPS